MPDALLYIMGMGLVLATLIFILYVIIPVLQYMVQMSVTAVLLPFCIYEKRKQQIKKNKDQINETRN